MLDNEIGESSARVTRQSHLPSYLRGLSSVITPAARSVPNVAIT
jgi:hypothetical protein